MKRTIITFLSLSIFSIGNLSAQTLTFGNSKTNAKASPATEFKVDSPIYGVLTLPNPIKSYTTNPKPDSWPLNDLNGYNGENFSEIIYFKVNVEILNPASGKVEQVKPAETPKEVKADKGSKLGAIKGTLRDASNGNVSLPKKNTESSSESSQSTSSSTTSETENKTFVYEDYKAVGVGILKRAANGNDLYFELIPEDGKAMTGFQNNSFYKVLTDQSSWFENKKLKLTFTYDAEKNKNIGNKSMNFSSSIILDYSDVSSDAIDELQTKWTEEFEMKKVLANIQDEITANATEKIFFGSSNSIANTSFKATYKAGEPIYAVLDLGKKLKEYAVEPASNLATQKSLTIPSINRILSVQMFYQVDGQEWERSPIIGEIGLTENMLDASKLILDIAPSVEGATNYFPFGSELYRNVNTQEFAGKKVNFGYAINDKTNALIQSGIEGINVEGQITIDFTGFTAKMIVDWNDKLIKATTNAKTAFINNENKFNYEKVKSMPLPICFTKESKGGYASVSKDKIISLIKQKYGVTEVLGLRFDGGGQGDFRELVDANTNYPTCKMGNTVFYFAFKEVDGSYRFTGGVLMQDYIGYGKYGEMYIKDYAPGQEGDVDYPYDYARDAKGNYSIFIFDGTKLK